jgi:DNA topoisomerase I
MRNLLIVESAGKIKKLKSILGSDWDVKASIGHIRQLANDGDGSLGVKCQVVRRDATGCCRVSDAKDFLDRHYLLT